MLPCCPLTSMLSATEFGTEASTSFPFPKPSWVEKIQLDSHLPRVGGPLVAPSLLTQDAAVPGPHSHHLSTPALSSDQITIHLTCSVSRPLAPPRLRTVSIHHLCRLRSPPSGNSIKRAGKAYSTSPQGQSQTPGLSETDVRTVHHTV